jgi:hypothetical protein
LEFEAAGFITPDISRPLTQMKQGESVTDLQALLNQYRDLSKTERENLSSFTTFPYALFTNDRPNVQRGFFK